MKAPWILVIALAVVVVVLGVLLVGERERVDVEAEQAALRNADIEWWKAAEAKDVEHALSLFADDASQFPPNAPIVTGKDAIRTGLSEEFALPGYALTGQPTKTEVSQAGNLGYTLGTFEVTSNDPEGKPVTERGKYVAIWKKQPDGTWKIVVDIWNSAQPAPSPASE